MPLEREVLLERRQSKSKQRTVWDELSLAQQFSARSLVQLGYELSFIRGSKSGNIAVLLSEQNTATINGDGEIDISPTIMLRASGSY